ncbi:MULTISPECIES: DUF3039 domain-containing protein [unclassified Aeromicrobium]|uniref:DUF3039 domain-containing protein n=1 Tax=unclassified Aeromicrobium TaxID=2633570 RepID=UPI002889764E|nr:MULTISPECIES: DUF3039 domain-containing protein [unclassified Aeromicrobium]
MSAAATLDRPIVETNTTTDPVDATHIVQTPAGEPDETPHAYVMRARIEGFPIVALCGYVFVPQHDPAPRPVCEPCKAEFERDPHGHGDRDRLPDA